MSGAPLDLETLHCLLWNMAAPDNTVRFEQQRFAEELGTTRFTLNRALQTLVQGGQLVRLSRSGSAIKQMYVVTDPAVAEQPCEGYAHDA